MFESEPEPYVTTDSQSASLSWNKAPIWGLRSDINYCLTITVLFCGGPLWREDGSVSCICCWPTPVQSFLGLRPFGLETIFYCLRFETSFFVASYDSQGYGGGIRHRLHMGCRSCLSFQPRYIASIRTHWKHRFHNYPKNSSTVIQACLPRRWIETSVFFMLFTYSLPRECVYWAVR
jgi:hypothetical protein